MFMIINMKRNFSVFKALRYDTTKHRCLYINFIYKAEAHKL